jgi:hypothetical protein
MRELYPQRPLVTRFAAEPGQGYNAKAAEWWAKLEEQTRKLENGET